MKLPKLMKSGLQETGRDDWRKGLEAAATLRIAWRCIWMFFGDIFWMTHTITNRKVAAGCLTTVAQHQADPQMFKYFLHNTIAQMT